MEKSEKSIKNTLKRVKKYESTVLSSIYFGWKWELVGLWCLRGKLGDRESHGIVQGGMQPEQQLRLNQTHAGIETANMRNNICQKKEEHSPSMISENLSAKLLSGSKNMVDSLDGWPIQIS